MYFDLIHPILPPPSHSQASSSCFPLHFISFFVTIMILTISPTYYNWVRGYEVSHWGISNLPSSLPQRKMTLPSFILHELPIAYPLELKSQNTLPILAGALTGSISCKSCVGHHISCCKLMRTSAMSFPEDDISQHPAYPLAVTSFPPILPRCPLRLG